MSRLVTLEQKHDARLRTGGLCDIRCPEQSQDKTPYLIFAYACLDCVYSYENKNHFRGITECLDSLSF